MLFKEYDKSCKTTANWFIAIGPLTDSAYGKPLRTRCSTSKLNFRISSNNIPTWFWICPPSVPSSELAADKYNFWIIRCYEIPDAFIICLIMSFVNIKMIGCLLTCTINFRYKSIQIFSTFNRISSFKKVARFIFR